MKKILITVAALIFLASCTPAQPAISPSEAAPTVHIPSPATTAIPTMTPAPTQTPQIPVLVGTPFPQPKEIITRDNVQDLVELVTFQNGHIITRYSADREKLFMADQSGVTVCKTVTSELFSNCESIINHFEIFIVKNEDRSFNTGNFLITPSGSFFLALTDTGLQLFNELGGEIFTKVLPQGDYSFALSPDGNLISILRGNRIIVIQIKDGEEVFSDDGSLARFSSDGKYLAVQKRMAVYLYSVSDWSNTYQFPQNQKDGWDISGNGALIANNTGKDLVLHNLSNGEYVKTIEDFDGGDLILSYEGKYALQIFSSSNSPYYKQIYGWDIDTGDKTKNVGLDVVDLSHLFVGDGGESGDDFSFYHSSIEKPWKSISEYQTIYLTDTDDVLIETNYPSDPYVYSKELCILTATSQIKCQSNFNPYFFDHRGQFFISDSGAGIGTCPFSKNAGEDLVAVDQCKTVNSLGDQFDLTAILPKVDLALISVWYRLQDARVIDLKTGDILNRWKGNVTFPKSSPNDHFIAFLNREWPTFPINYEGVV